MVRPRLIVITDTTVVSAERILTRVEALVSRSCPHTIMVELRDRELPVRSRAALGLRLRELTRAHEQWFAVNDRIDLARLLGADGLHLGEQSVPVAEARRLWGAGFISRACHDPEQATPNGADAVVLSPVVAPRKGNPALGLEALARARHHVQGALLVALGGVGGDSAAACLAAGAGAVAAIGAAIGGDDPAPLLAAVGAIDGPARAD
ncbi:MAG: thiamine phosphate synthase [Polyangiaceae bacterium]|nr:thiamine phosphate synthase [Polyangiaceae bacterium]